MNVLFVHNNFPAQFRSLAEALVQRPGVTVKAIGAADAPGVRGVETLRYRVPRPPPAGAVHAFARRFDFECRRAEEVMVAASALVAGGFRPDLVVAHCGWGETLPLRALFPQAHHVVYAEFFYRAEGLDVHFDPEFPPLGADGVTGLQCRNAATLIALAEADRGLSPTLWQRSTFPEPFHAKIDVCHEGVDVEALRPVKTAKFVAPSGEAFEKGEEIVTFCARDLEPMRGYHVFMRALVRILAQRPKARALIIGGDGVSYGMPPEGPRSWRDTFWQEVRGQLDERRVTFLGRVGYAAYVDVLSVSAAHVYLTYPFVLSWSLVEAMALGAPIVASDTPPVREVIDGENGRLAPFFAPDAIADAAIGLLKSKSARAALGARARATAVARFDRRERVEEAMRLLGVAEGLR